MSISEHHQNRLEEIEDKIGLEKLSELSYRISLGDNFWRLREVYNLELYELRYLDTCHRELTVYLYEKERNSLRLVYQRVA